MDQFEALVRLNQLRARKSKDLSLKWIILSSCTCVLLLFGSFSYNWLYTNMSPQIHLFGRDMYPFGSMHHGSAMGDYGGTYGAGLAGLGNSVGAFGSMYGMTGHGFRRPDLISTVGPFTACFESRSKYDFFGFQCRLSTDTFLRHRNRSPTSLIFCEFLLILGSLLFVVSTIGSCCGCFGRHRFIGFLQSGAGFIYLLGIMLFFGNLGDRNSKMICGIMTESFYTGYCHLGIGLYVSIIANITMFVCSLIYLKSLNNPIRRKSMPHADKV